MTTGLIQALPIRQRTTMKKIVWALVYSGGMVLALLNAGCGPQNEATQPSGSVSQAVPANAPSSADIAAQRAMASKMMAQTRIAARETWQQQHPGQPLPGGL